MMLLSDVSRKDEIELSKGLACYVGALLLSLFITCILLLLVAINQMTGMQGMVYTSATAASSFLVAHVLARRRTGFHASCHKYGLKPVFLVSDFAKSNFLSL
jgi:tryptophan synthase alpha subunit